MPRRDLILVSFLLADSFVWYYTIRALQEQSTANIGPFESNLINGTYFAAIIFSSIVGVLASRKAGRTRVLYFWLILGCISTVLPFLVVDTQVDQLLVTAFIFGASFGIGMPSCLALFADSTAPENRGISGGIIFVATNLGAFALAFVAVDRMTTQIISLGLRIAALCVFLISKSAIAPPKEARKDSPLISLPTNRTFLLYAVPWLIFALVDSFERIYFAFFFEAAFFDLMSVVEPAVGTAFVLIAGLLADRIGRKRVLIYGFVALGIGYASIGLAPFLDVSRYFYMTVDGVAWGTFMVVYMLILWGDLPTFGETAEKYYAFGSIPFFLADLLVLVAAPYAETISGAGPYAIFSLASFFLFLAVVPLMLALETLPEKKMKERELKGYLDKAKKVKEKYT